MADESLLTKISELIAFPQPYEKLSDWRERTANEILAKATPIIEREQAKEFNKILTPLRDKLAEIDKKLNDREADLTEAKKQEDNKIADWLLTQGAIWVDKNYSIIEAIRKGQVR